MKTLISTSCAALLGITALAGTPGTPAAPTVDTKSVPAPTLSAKTHSDFDVHIDSHNPFWPIGWVKTEAISSSASDTAASITPHAEDFNVSTILLNDPPMAVINGKDMAEGEIAALPVNGQTVVVQLMTVQDGKVTLRWQNQSLTVLIHRDESLNSTAITTAQR